MEMEILIALKHRYSFLGHCPFNTQPRLSASLLSHSPMLFLSGLPRNHGTLQHLQLYPSQTAHLCTVIGLQRSKCP